MTAPQHIVLIASTRRPEVLGRTVDSLRAQTIRPDLVVLGVAADGDVPNAFRADPWVRVVVGERGSSVQRNTAFRSLEVLPDLVTFMDDDAVLARDYIEKARAYMTGHPDVALMTGLVVVDGANEDREISRDEAAGALAAHRPTEFERDVRAAYGANMTARGAVVAGEPFDERLRLYAWQEDYDFSVRAGRLGRVVHYHGCVAVHLAVGSGRVDGRTLGFAQIVNPFYLWRKGTKSARQLVHDWAVYLGANVIHLRDRHRPDREGRLHGNLLGLREVVLHGGRPEAVAALRRAPRPHVTTEEGHR
ncbi:GT2 family glycosyltransferase [Luteimicrobium subarcticum]|uniref:GT2 family glycosyltransferase n=1 Tax=Luteimicrobium subarcticum TaxID=620910 RepID=A0A2M8WT99_9MICO|nr:glycosyltransferase [Luteimicrobium subarcticum]PJI94118.1 GT2 family glycosyltransferase [Luteimicrobium subarcticum]